MGGYSNLATWVPQKTFTLALIKQRFQKWVERHPDVLDEGVSGRFWYVQNCVGDLIDWEESPEEWMDV
jgi:hypothetical protein